MPYPSTSFPAALGAALSRAVTSFLTHQRHARDGRPRSVHEARVASRRLREALPALVVDDRLDVGALRRDIRRVARALGRVRELDVAMDLVGRHEVARSWSRVVIAAVRRELERERIRHQEGMIKKLDRNRVRDLGRQLRALARAARVQRHSAFDDTLAARRRMRARALGAALEGAGVIYEPARLHGVRIATKKLRYTLEWIRTSITTDFGGQVTELKAAQQLLGELNDLHTLQLRLRRLAGRAGADRRTSRAFQAAAVQLEAASRERHAQFLKVAPRLLALATDLARKTPLEWIRRRPARINRDRFVAAPNARAGGTS